MTTRPCTVVDRLCRLRRQGTIQRWGDVAILLRSVRSYAGPYLGALLEHGVSYAVTGAASFFEREEVQGMWQLLSFLGASKPWGDKFVRHPIMGLRKETVKALQGIKDDLLGFARREALSAAGVAHPGDQDRLLRLVELKQRVQAGRYTSLLDVFHRM